jgi:hypothetical protein
MQRALVVTTIFLLMQSGAARAATATGPLAHAEVCATQPPHSLLNAAEPAEHSFSTLPHHRAIETAKFAGAVAVRIEQRGCAGPAVARFRFSFPSAMSANKKALATLVTFLDAHVDAFSMTPLALPQASRALHELVERKLSYVAQTRICLLDSGATSTSQTSPPTKCARWISIDWSRDDLKMLTVFVNYSDEAAGKSP